MNHLRALMYSPQLGIYETDARIYPATISVYPTCKGLPLMPMADPLMCIIYVQKHDLAEAKVWFEDYVQRSLMAIRDNLPTYKMNLNKAIEALRGHDDGPIELWISPELVAAIINNDMSGLDDADINAIECFEKRYNHIVLSDSEQVRWTTCEVTGLVGNCVRVYHDRTMATKLSESAA